MKPKPRVMFVGPYPPAQGGIMTFMLNVEKSQLKERYEFIRFDISRPPKKNVIDNYGYQSVLQGGIRRIIYGIVLTSWNMVKFPFVVVARRIDVVQVHASDFQTYWEAALYVLMCRALRRPVLLRLGGAFDYFYEVSSPWAQKLIRRVLQLPDRLIVQSPYWRNVVARLGRNAGVVILANSVPDALTEPVTRSGITAPVCLFIASVDAVRKGVDEVITAMRTLMDWQIPVRFHLLAMPAQLKERVVAEGLTFPVEVDGYVEHDRMLTAMRTADIFLLPSRGEGFPNSLVEAMATGLACIVTPVGAIPEIVGEDGAIIVPVRDGAALAAAIKRLALDSNLRQQFGERGRAIVRERYVEGVVFPVLDRAYRELLHQSAPMLAE